MNDKSYGQIFENPTTRDPMGADGKPFAIDLRPLQDAPEMIVHVLNSIPKETFHLARFSADERTMDIIQDKLPGWYEKLREHAEKYQSGN